MESLNFTKNKFFLICLAVLGIAVIAVTVFKVSIGNLFFYGVLLACPLIHIFMMKGHGGHNHEGRDNAKQSGKTCH